MINDWAMLRTYYVVKYNRIGGLPIGELLFVGKSIKYNNLIILG